MKYRITFEQIDYDFNVLARMQNELNVEMIESYNSVGLDAFVEVLKQQRMMVEKMANKAKAQMEIMTRVCEKLSKDLLDNRVTFEREYKYSFLQNNETLYRIYINDKITKVLIPENSLPKNIDEENEFASMILESGL